MLLCPWDFSGKNTRVGCHFLLQGNLSDSGNEPTSLRLLHWQAGSLPLAALWKPIYICVCMYSCSVAQSCPTFFNPLDCSTLGLPAPHHLPKFAQVHCIGDAIIYIYIYTYIYVYDAYRRWHWASQVAQCVKNPPAMQGKQADVSSIPGLGRSPGGEHGNPPGFSPGESRGERSLVEYSPWGQKESDTTEVTEHACTHMMASPYTVHIYMRQEAFCILSVLSPRNQCVSSLYSVSVWTRHSSSAQWPHVASGWHIGQLMTARCSLKV